MSGCDRPPGTQPSSHSLPVTWCNRTRWLVTSALTHPPPRRAPHRAASSAVKGRGGGWPAHRAQASVQGSNEAATVGSPSSLLGTDPPLRSPKAADGSHRDGPTRSSVLVYSERESPCPPPMRWDKLPFSALVADVHSQTPRGRGTRCPLACPETLRGAAAVGGGPGRKEVPVTTEGGQCWVRATCFVTQPGSPREDETILPFSYSRLTHSSTIQRRKNVPVMQIHPTCIYIFHHSFGYKIFSADSQHPKPILFTGCPGCAGRVARPWRRGRKWMGCSLGSVHKHSSPWCTHLLLEVKQFPVSPFCGRIIKSRQDNRVC